MRLFSFEGGDGVGKSTLIQYVKDALMQEGHSVLVIREPGTSSLAEQIRRIWKADSNMNSKSEVLLFLASRADMIQTVIKANEQNFDFILMDRYIDSTIAYQGFGRGLNIDLLTQLNRFVIEDYIPEKTFYIHIDEETRNQRYEDNENKEVDPFDTNQDYRRRVIAGYQYLLSQDTDNRFVSVRNDDIQVATNEILSTILRRPVKVQRQRLAKIKKETIDYQKYRAKIIRYGWTPEGNPTLLLGGISGFYSSSYLVDHAWVMFGPEWIEANMILPGDEVAFEARIDVYSKGEGDTARDDYRFAGVHNVEIIKKVERKDIDTGALDEDLTYLLEIQDPDTYDHHVKKYVNFVCKIYDAYYQKEDEVC